MTEYVNFTQTNLHNIIARPKRYEIADIKIPGLRLTVYPSGKKTFILLRSIQHRTQRIKIGRFYDLTVEQARKQAIKYNAAIALGIELNPTKKNKKPEMTFHELFQKYYNEYAQPHTKRPEENRKLLEYHVLPHFGSMELSEIGKDKIRQLHVKIGAKSKASANRVMHMVSAIFNFGINNDYFKGTNPCIGLIKYRIASRDRFLSKDELKDFFMSIEEEPEIFKHFFLICLFTGARKTNVLKMRWTDMDLNLKMWRISEKDAKNNDINIVYLSEAAVEVLQKRKADQRLCRLDSNYVFPGSGALGYLNDPSRSFRRIKMRMGITNFRIHDLRRTFASYMAINGASLSIIGKALNHKSQVSTAIYARLNQLPVIEAINSGINLMTK